MIKIESADQVRQLLPPAPPRNGHTRKRREDAGRRPFLPCELCRGRGTLGPTVTGAAPQTCEECSGSGRAR